VKNDILKQIDESQKVYRKLKEKTDREIAFLIIEHIYSEMDIFSIQGLLIEEVIERLLNGPCPA
jgi:predicted nucleotidyltransferase